MGIMRSFLYLVFILFMVFIGTRNTYAQFDFNKRLTGLTIKLGQSNSINTNIPIPNSSGFLVASMGLYKYLNLNSKNDLRIPFHYLRTEFNLGVRKGIFSVNDLNQIATIDVRYFELVLIAPLTWEFNDNTSINVGMGGTLGYVRSETIVPDSNPIPFLDKGNVIKLGIVGDIHILFIGKSNAQIGTRVLIEPMKYSFFEWSGYFSFGLPQFRRNKK